MRRRSYRAERGARVAPFSSHPAPESGAAIELAAGLSIPLRYANRHGLISGPTGTGKSVTLLRLAEGFQAAGSAVFLADVKGDLAPLASRTMPVTLLDAYSAGPGRFAASPGDMGADLFARALDMSDAQAGTLELAFHLAATEGHPLASAADLLALLSLMLARSKELTATLGAVSPASVGIIRRAMLRLDHNVISAPSFDVARLVQPGAVNVLQAETLMRSPRLYAALLMYTLDQLEQRLPEVGDQPAPRLAFFFDEAHLLFRDVPPALLSRIERTVRLIRSKGVGVYFASQLPEDIPQTVCEQLAHRIAHSRALGVGTARVETLSADGRTREPATVRILAPACLTAPPIRQEAPTAPPARPEPHPPPRTANARAALAVRDPSPMLALMIGAAVLALAFIGGATLLGVRPSHAIAAATGLLLAPLVRVPWRRHRRH